MITIIKYINKLFRHKDLLKKKWKNIGIREGFIVGRGSAQDELVGIRKLADIKINDITYKIKEEIRPHTNEIYFTREYMVYYYFKPEMKAYKLAFHKNEVTENKTEATNE